MTGSCAGTCASRFIPKPGGFAGFTNMVLLDRVLVIGPIGFRIGEKPVLFGAVIPLDQFEQLEKRLTGAGVDFILTPEVRQPGTVREQKLMTCRDGCGNAVEFKGLKNVTDVYAT